MSGNDGSKEPMLCLGRMYKKTSKSGMEYFTGKLGFCDILLFPDTKASEPGIYRLMIKERPYDPSKAAQAQPAQQGQQPGQFYGMGGGAHVGYDQQRLEFQQQKAPQGGQYGRQLPPEPLEDEIPF